MKILFVNQFYWPDVAATGQLLTDLTRHLSQEHEITVICSAGSYDRIQTGDECPPVRIIRVPGVPFQRGAAGRLLSYATFLMGAMISQFFLPRQDVIVTMTTPPLLAIAGRMLKAVRRSRHYIWEMDVFPDAFVSLGALKQDAWLTKALSWIEDSCRRNCDGIVALGKCMRRRLIARGVPEGRVLVAENWADGNAIAVETRRRSGPLHILYSGNLGLAHDADTIVRVMDHFRADPRFVFMFSGGGVGRSELQRTCAERGIRNTRFLPYAPREQMSAHLGQADIGLVTERRAFLGTVVPSKIYGLMASGRPILFIGPRTATAGFLVRRFACGWTVEPGQVAPLIDLLESLYARRAEIRVRGRRARRAFERHYDLPCGVERVAACLGLRPVPRSSTISNPERAHRAAPALHFSDRNITKRSG